MRNVAKHFSLSPTAVFRHKAHVEKRLVEAKEREEAVQDRDLSAELTKLAARANRLADQAERDGDLRTSLQGIRELSRLIELEARLAGQIGTRAHININNLNITEWTRQERADLMVRLFESTGLPIPIFRALAEGVAEGVDEDIDDEPPVERTPSTASSNTGPAQPDVPDRAFSIEEVRALPSLHKKD